MAAADRQELLFLAQDTVDNIRDLKHVSHALMISYSASFGFVWHEDIKSEQFDALVLLFILGTLFVVFVCALFFPNKLAERRARLKRIYDQFGAAFHGAHKKVSSLCQEDIGDRLYTIFSVLYPSALLSAYLLHHFSIV